jgi:hypothetical protein
MYKGSVLSTGFEKPPVPPISTEVRCAVRFPLELPVQVELDGETVRAVTCNLSSSGILMTSSVAVPVGTLLHFLLTMPSHVLGCEEDVLVRCTGRVVRCKADSTEFLIAVTLDEYIFQTNGKYDY